MKKERVSESDRGRERETIGEREETKKRTERGRERESCDSLNSNIKCRYKIIELCICLEW